MTNNDTPHPRRQSKVIDGFTRAQPRSLTMRPAVNQQPVQLQSAPAQPSPSPHQQAVAQQPAARPKHQPKKRTFQIPTSIKLAGIVILASIAGYSMQFPPAGYAVLAVYGIIAIATKIKSTTTFLLSVLTLITVVILLVRHNQDMATQYATYTFILWVIGTISMGIERRHNAKNRRGLRISTDL